MKRLITIEIDDAGSPSLRKNPRRALKRLLSAVADELNWGDTQRELQDKDGNTVGKWTMTTTADATVQ